jgi:transglutaminase-like putative cysteine protease
MTGTLLLLSLGIGVTASLANGAEGVSSSSQQPAHRTIRYTLTARNLSGEAIRGATVRADAPVKRTATQETLNVTASHPFELIADELGNQTLAFSVDLAPYASKVIAVEAVVGFLPQEGVSRTSLSADAAALAGADDPSIQRTALVLDGSTPAEVARSAFEWVAEHVSDSGYTAEERGPLSALTTGTGDCTEQASLFVALARARGIPARMMAGYIIGSGGIIRSGSYHNWAEYYADGAWHIADPQHGLFAVPDQLYLATRILGVDDDTAVSPVSIEVRMN